MLQINKLQYVTFDILNSGSTAWSTNKTKKMVSLMEVQLFFFGALIELTPSGDYESVTGLISTQICGIHVGYHIYLGK